MPGVAILDRNVMGFPKVSTAVSGGSPVTVLGASQTAPDGTGISSGPGTTAVDVGLDLLKFDKKCIQLKNVGANALTACVVQTTNVPAEARVASDWETFDSTTFTTLAAGATKSLQVANDCHRFWRVQATCAAGTTIEAYLTIANGT